MTVSVCMAVYNGALFVEKQVESILPQMGADDELIAVDDCSTDNSVACLEGFHDPRIRIFRQPENRGVVRTFERALREAKGEVIFLCDQDDVWMGDKIQKFRKAFLFYPEVSLVISNGVVIDSEGRVIANTWLDSKTFRPGLFQNLVQNRYLGCAMAFRRRLLNYCLPFPDDIPMHDIWIGLVNQIVGKACFIPDPLFSYRRHGNTVTTGKHASVEQMVKWRLALARNLINIGIRNMAPTRSTLLGKGK